MLLLLWILPSHQVRAAVYIVTTINDSGAGSLRQAIANANSNPGLDTIAFNIPGTGPFAITLASNLPAITDSVIIDGSTQPGYAGTPLIQIVGGNIGANNDGLMLTAGGNTIRGLAISQCPRDGIRLLGPTGSVIQGNYLGTDPTGAIAQPNGEDGLMISNSPGNLVGGTVASNANIISGNQQNGIFIYGATASNNVISGNYIGTSTNGKAALGNGYAGIAVSNAPGDTIGGTTVGAGNLISGNGNSGIILGGNPTTATVIEGNYIGTDATGSNALANANGGIYSYGSGTNTIGGTVAHAGNLISGNLQEGISIGDPGANYNVIQGNFIGTKADGISPLGNQLNNIDFSNTASNNLVGGTTAAADNRIAFVQNPLYDGVRVRVGCLGNFISRNSIFSNGNLGILVGTAGVNTNNLPSLTQAIAGNGTIMISGSLPAAGNQSFLLQFYDDAAPNPTGYGEGLTYLGSTNVTTSAAGLANFVLTLPVGVPAGSYLSATATDSTNTTWDRTIPQDLIEWAGTFCVLLPHGRDE